MNRQAVKKFLLAYAWLETDSEAQKVAEVECILKQGDWKYLDDRADMRAGASETGGGPKEFADAVAMELTALYECHDEPHTPGCPRNENPQAFDLNAFMNPEGN